MEQESASTESETQVADDKTLAIMAYITIIGLIIAFIMYREKKDKFSAFHIRQSLGLCLCGIVIFVVGLIPILGWIASFFGSLLLLYLWIMGLINAINGRRKSVPLLGDNFKEWFKNI
ncbi:DUF4870 domain-containing protein [Autumnicola musiva]|uniref:DUF4870 domain-containing protein n=1 Tax=Autumnicola musiva TaxID=3075589 RepID=A0ABU3D6L3_9FLAO|nr:hypothetical protein [Zunongwangia sp. F117]MDT0677174.1 hypothetical protein [Zunongwangia sp. F117]